MLDSTYPCFLLEEEATSGQKFVIVRLSTFTKTQTQSYDRLTFFTPMDDFFFTFCGKKSTKILTRAW